MKATVFFKKQFLFVLALAAFCLNADGQQLNKPVRIGTKLFPPFVVEGSNGELTGFSIEYWETIAKQLNIDFEYVKADNVQTMLDNLKNGVTEAAISGISTTSQRETDFDFSYSYKNSGLGILVLNNKHFNFLHAITRVLSNKQVWISLVAFIAFIIAGGHVLWFFERGQNAISDEYCKGIEEGCWCAFAVSTTIGFGDIAPKRKLGRLAAIPLALAGFIVMGTVMSVLGIDFLNAQTKPVLTVNDLRNKNVAVIENTTSEKEVKKYKLKNLVLVKSFDGAIKAIDSGNVDAVVYDYPVLQNFVKVNGTKKYTIASEMFALQDYSIAFPSNSSLVEEVNRAHLRIQESGIYRELVRKYF